MIPPTIILFFLNFQKYFHNLLELDKQDLDQICNFFESLVRDSVISNSALSSITYKNYIYGNLNDRKFVEKFEILSTKIDKYSKYCSFNYYKIILNLYEKITGKEFAEKDKIIKDFIEQLVLKELNSIDNDFTAYKDIKKLIEESKKYKKYYNHFKAKHNPNKNIKSLEDYNLDIDSFHSNKIELYNQFNIDEIVEFFKENNEFCEKFFEYFININLTEQKIEKYDLSNNLFQAYKKFLNQEECRIKKEAIIEELKKKKILNKDNEEREVGGVLLKLLNEN